MDELLTTVHEQSSQPILRVLFACEHGKKVWEQAEAMNAKLLAKATKLTTLTTLQDLEMNSLSQSEQDVVPIGTLCKV